MIGCSRFPELWCTPSFKRWPWLGAGSDFAGLEPTWPNPPRSAQDPWKHLQRQGQSHKITAIVRMGALGSPVSGGILRPEAPKTAGRRRGQRRRSGGVWFGPDRAPATCRRRRASAVGGGGWVSPEQPTTEENIKLLSGPQSRSFKHPRSHACRACLDRQFLESCSEIAPAARALTGPNRPKSGPQNRSSRAQFGPKLADFGPNGSGP